MVSLPRSGTTLVKQMLASHFDVFGVGELTILGDLANGIDFSKPNKNTNLIKEIREPYLANLNRLSKDCTHVVDKMPLNFFWVGLIIDRIPEAKIIHV